MLEYLGISISLVLTSFALYFVISLKGQVAEVKAKLAALEIKLTTLEQSKPSSNNTSLPTSAELAEKQEEELNTLWEELETLRKELVVQQQTSISAAQWQAFCEKRMPGFTIIKTELRTLMSVDVQVAAQLETTLPAYLTGDHLLAGLIDIVHQPFEQINWLDTLILPISPYLENTSNATLNTSFEQLLAKLGYGLIKPIKGETYQADQHEVVEQRLATSPRGTILATQTWGYYQNGKVVRKAKITISAGQ